MAQKHIGKEFTTHGHRNPRVGRGGTSRSDHGASQVVIMRKPRENQNECEHLNESYKTSYKTSNNIKKIATWNTRSMFKAGKHANVLLEMNRLGIDILGISEMRWPGSGKVVTRDHVTYYSGGNDPEHQYGVGLIVTKEIDKAITNFVPYSDRTLLVQIQNTPININIIQGYAPTTKKEEQEVERFYEEIDCLAKSTSSQDITIIMGDLNAKVGKGEQGTVVGRFGLGERNDRGERLISFCEENNYIITNTMFQHHPRRLYTWTKPEKEGKPKKRNQIDYIIINERYRNSIKNVKTYPGTDIGSDHNPVVASFRLRLKKIVRNRDGNRMDIPRILEPNIKNKISVRINEEIRTMLQNAVSVEDIDNTWTILKEKIHGITRDILKSQTQQQQRKKEWMTTEILDLMNERRKVKNTKTNKYREINNTIIKKIREAKEKWITEKCEEIESFEKRYDHRNIHKTIKEVCNNRKNNHYGLLTDKEGKVIITVEKKLARWKEYVEELYNDNRTDSTYIKSTEMAPEITKEEILHAITNAKTNKAVGPDEIPAEIIKLIEEDNIEVLLNLFNAIHRSGNIPKDWLKTTFVPIPKTTHPRTCEEYRNISLMSHVLKIFLKIIHARIFNKCEFILSETQLGFRNGYGTREALFALNVLTERCLDVNTDVYIGFIDYTKAFDRIQHNKLIEILEELNLDYQDLRLITNLYWKQTACVRTKEGITEEISIKRGVRQGCILSPLLFNVYSENIFKTALSGRTEGIKINGRIINNIRYADDSILIAETEHDLQNLFNCLYESSAEYGLDMNLKKTKYMVITKKQPTLEGIVINNKIIQRTSGYKYLGTIISDGGKQQKEVRSRIGQARCAFNNLKAILCNRSLKLQLRRRFLKCCVFSVLFHGMEAWTLTQDLCNKINAFEMWTYRRMLRVSWMARVSNVKILEKMNCSLELMTTIKRRKLEYLGHIMRGEKYQLLQLILQGRIEGKRSPGRRRTSWLRNLRDWYNKSTRSLFRAAVSKVQVALLIANIR